MAYDNPLFPTGRGYALLKNEGTYGVDPTVGVADFLNFDEFTMNFEEEQIDRGGRSPQRVGWRNLAGPQTMSWSFSLEMLMQAIDEVGSPGTTAPQVDAILKACGFDRTDGAELAVDLDIFTYVCTRNQEGSFWVQNYHVNEAMDSLNIMTARGCRGTFTIEFNAGERIMLNCEGMGLTNGGLATHSHSEASPHNVVDVSDDPIMTIGADDGIKLIDVQNLDDRDGTEETIYGGGTIAAPTNAVDVISLTINGNMNPVAHRGFNVGRSPQRVFMDAQDRMTAEIVFEVSDQDDWDPYSLRYRSAMEFNFTFLSDITGGGSTMQVLFYGFFTSIEMDENDGRHIYTCGVDLAYPENCQTGVPAVGDSPNQLFTASNGAGIGQGLNVDPTPSLVPMIPGLLALQFRSV